VQLPEPTILSNGAELYDVNGTYYYVDNNTGRSTNDQELIKKILEQEKGEEAIKGNPDALRRSDNRAILEQTPNASLLGNTLNYVQGAPFVGEYFDEIISQNPAEKSKLDQFDAAFEEEHPIQSGVSGVAGGIIQSIPFMAAGAGAAGAVPGVANHALTNGLLGSVIGQTAVGAADGAVSGYGRGRTDEERQGNAVVGGGIGAGTGVLSPAVTRGGQAIYRGIKGMNADRQVANEISELGVEVGSQAANSARRVITPDDRAEAQLGVSDESMLADGFPQVADAIAASGPVAARQVNNAVGGRAQEAAKSTDNWLTSFFASAAEKRGSKADLVQGARDETTAATNKAYTEAYNTPINYNTPEGQQLESALTLTLQNVKGRTFQDAIDRANREIATDPLIPTPMRTEIKVRKDDAGNIVGFEGDLSVVHIDKLKQSLDGLVDATGDPSYGRLAERIVAATDAATGGTYAAARQAGGNRIKDGQAVQAGALATSPTSNNSNAAQMESAWKRYSESEKQNFRIGFINELTARLGKVKASLVDGMDPDGIPQSKALLAQFATPDFQKKMELMLTPEEFSRFNKELDQLRQAFVTRSQVGGNSATVPRGETIAAIDESLEPGIVATLGRGELPTGMQKGIQALSGYTDDYMASQRDKVYGQLASLMTELKGADAQRAYQIIVEASQKYADDPEMMKRIAQIMKSIGYGVRDAGQKVGNSYE